MNNSKCQSWRIRKALLDAPSTCRELSAALKINLRQVQIGIWVLLHGGYVQVAGKVINTEEGRGQRRRLNLYELTPRASGPIVTQAK